MGRALEVNGTYFEGLCITPCRSAETVLGFLALIGLSRAISRGIRGEENGAHFFQGIDW